MTSEIQNQNLSTKAKEVKILKPTKQRPICPPFTFHCPQGPVLFFLYNNSVTSEISLKVLRVPLQTGYIIIGIP